MKRHESLVPLSREHHDGLILAQLIKKNAPMYRGLPQSIEEKVRYAKQFYQYDILKHFEKEEQMLKKIRPISAQLSAAADTIEFEHKKLHELFSALSLPGDKEEQLHEAGVMLEAHIRKEEREIFPLIEKSCSPELLQELQPLLT